jgi:hypothetical protein
MDHSLASLGEGRYGDAVGAEAELQVCTPGRWATGRDA